MYTHKNTFITWFRCKVIFCASLGGRGGGGERGGGNGGGGHGYRGGFQK